MLRQHKVSHRLITRSKPECDSRKCNLKTSKDISVAKVVNEQLGNYNGVNLSFMFCIGETMYAIV